MSKGNVLIDVMLPDLPRNSSLVLLMDTGAGIMGAEELNSLVGVSCCHKTSV